MTGKKIRDISRNVNGRNLRSGDTPIMKGNSDASTMFGNRVANVPLRLSNKNHIWVYIYDEYKYKTSIFWHSLSCGQRWHRWDNMYVGSFSILVALND